MRRAWFPGLRFRENDADGRPVRPSSSRNRKSAGIGSGDAESGHSPMTTGADDHGRYAGKPMTGNGTGNASAGRVVTPRVFIGSSLFALGLVCSTLVFTPIALASTLLPYRLRWRAVTQWSRFNVYWLSVTCGVRCEVEGLENVPDEPTVVLSKHESAWETLALQRYFAPQVWVLKRELLRIPFFGWGLATMRPIAIDRNTALDAFRQMIEQGEERLASGCWVVVFPEGTRVPPGVRGRFKQGGARLAVHTGRPVVPVAHNAGDCWPRNSFFKYPGTIHVVIGEPIETTGRKAAEVNRTAERWIGDTVDGIRGGG